LIKSAERGREIIHFEINCPLLRPRINEGDSIAIDGCDLTATKLGQSGFKCDATLETLKRTTLADLAPGSKVNLELSLTPSTPISGHIVLGHIDGAGTIRSFKRLDNQAELVVALPKELMRFVAEKGSIAVSGVGLTVADVRDDSFSCWIIPYTLEHTTLGAKRPGDKVNVEVDVLARYVVHAIEAGVMNRGGRITEEFLKEHGFT
jgi:riboflavin synthase